MGTDRYAYQSRLRRISPMPKLLLTGSALVLCLLCDSVTVGLVTLLGMWGLVTALGGLSPRVFLRFLCIPMAFLAVGCVTILINSYPQGAPVLLAVPVGERLWGFDGAALLRAGDLSLLVTGDMDTEGEWRLLRTHNLPQVDLLVAGHHGARDSTSEPLLERLQPKAVAISVGKNSYGHPSEETIERIVSRGAEVFRTDLQGTLRIKGA